MTKLQTGAAIHTPIDFRDILRQKMKDDRISQRKLSALTGIRQATISDYLTGKSSLTADNLQKIFNTL